MKKLFVLFSVITSFAVVSCVLSVNKSEQSRLDSLKQDSIMKATDTTVVTTKKVVGKSYSNLPDILFIGPISLDNGKEGSRKAVLFLNAFNKAIKWGKLNKNIKINITKDLMDLSDTDNIIAYIATIDSTPKREYISFNYSFQGYSDGTWSIMITPDKVKKDGHFINSSPSDATFLKEQEIYELIPKLKEIIISEKNQSEKEKLFN